MLEDMKRHVTKDDLDILIQPQERQCGRQDIGPPYTIGFTLYAKYIPKRRITEYEGGRKRDVTGVLRPIPGR